MFVFASLASLGLPGLSGFPGEFASVVASFARFGWPVALVGIGVVLAGAYNLRAVRAVVHGEPAEDAVANQDAVASGDVTEVAAAPSARMADLGVREILAITPLVLLIVAIGLWPRLVTDLAAPALSDLLKTLAGWR